MPKQLLPIERKKLSELKKSDYNPRIITKDEMAGLKQSIDTFGIVEQIVWNKQTGNIVSGHQRYEAIKMLGYSEIDVVVVDLDKHAEKKLNVIMNSPAISGKYDELKLAEILEELKLDDDYEGLRLNKLSPLDLSDKYNNKEVDIDNLINSDKSKTCPRCGFEYEI